MRRARRAENIRKMARPSARVELMVDALVLIGFPAAERYVIGDALSHELERMLSGGDPCSAFQQNAELPALNAGSITLPPQRTLGSVGAQVAQAIYGSLTAGVEGGKQ